MEHILLTSDGEVLENQQHIEIELRHHSEKSVFLIITPDSEIWVDTKGLPNSAFLCACYDVVSLIKGKVGEEGKEEERAFLPMDWLINDWGGPQDLIAILKKRKEETLEDLPRLREKYRESK